MRLLVYLALVLGVFHSRLDAAPLSTWFSTNIPGVADLSGLCYGNKMFVAVGPSRTIITSTNGVNWTPRGSSVSGQDLYAITWGTNGFVAVGGWNGNGLVYTSVDGLTWTVRTVTNLSLQYGNRLQAVTWGKGLYVATGGNSNTNTVATSTNGIDWTPRETHASNTYLTPFSCAAYGGGVFVIGGKKLMTSEDGITWTDRTPPGLYRVDGLVYGGGRFVGVGPYTRIASSDGTNWVSVFSENGSYASSVTFGDGYYVYVGNTFFGFCTNGTNWFSPSTLMSGTAVTFANGAFVSVRYGTSARNAADFKVGLVRNPTPAITLTGIAPGKWRIEGAPSCDLTNNWVTLTNLDATTNRLTWIDSASTNGPTRFYRASWSP